MKTKYLKKLIEIIERKRNHNTKMKKRQPFPVIMNFYELSLMFIFNHVYKIFGINFV